MSGSSYVHLDKFKTILPSTTNKGNGNKIFIDLPSRQGLIVSKKLSNLESKECSGPDGGSPIWTFRMAIHDQTGLLGLELCGQVEVSGRVFKGDV